MSENMATKARRLLVEGRVRILEASEDDACVSALVRGDSGEYVVSHDTDSGWSCTCDAFRSCSHIGALRLVFVVVASRVAA